jgi:hypothetical protein
MVNKYNGEISLIAGDQEYVLKFGTYALIELEEYLGRSFSDLLEELNNPKTFMVKTAVAMIWAALQDHHQGISIKEVSGIVDLVGIQNTITRLSEALKLAFPELEVSEDGDKNPPQSTDNL